MFIFHVTFKSSALNGGIWTKLTFIRFVSTMSHLMPSQGIVISRLIVALWTFKRFFTGVLPHVHFQHWFSRALVVTNLTNVRFQSTVDSLNVFFQAFGIGERFLTQIALFPGKPRRNGFFGLVHMSNGVISKLRQLSESFVTNRTNVFFAFAMNLLVDF